MLHKFDNWLQSAASYEKKWRDRALLSFRYYEGEQWTEEEKAGIEARGQQSTVLNVVRPTVDMVLALEVQKRVDMQIMGREPSDEPIALILTELLKQIFDSNDIEYYQSQVFREGIIGGRGWAFVYPQKDETNQVQIHVDWIPWQEVYIDPFHRKPDGSDARYIIRCVWMDRGEAKKKYGNKADEIDSKFLPDSENTLEFNANNGSFYYDSKQDRIKICQCWYRDFDNQIKFVVFSDEIFLVGSREGDNKSPFKISSYPLVPFTAFRKVSGEAQGLVEFLKDGQDQINKLNSKYLWNMSANRIIVEEGAANDLDAVQEEWNLPNGIVKLEAGGLAKVRMEDNLRESAYLSQHLQFLLGMIQRTSGINDSMLGVGGTNERSATQQQNRIYQGASLQTKILENLHFTKKRISKLILNLIGSYYDDYRVVRVTRSNEEVKYFELNKKTIDGQGYEQILNNIQDVIKYDVILKAVEPFTTVRERTMQIFSEVAKTGILPPEFVGKVMIELSDMPHKQELLQSLQGMQQAQAQQAMAMQQQG